jgi:hypothetical protein
VKPFFFTDGARFVATESTRGPWSNDHQHAGPPSALLVRAMEKLAPGLRLARITCEMLKPVPIGAVSVDLAVEKPGKKTMIFRAKLIVDGNVLIDARALMMRETATPVLLHDESKPPHPSTCPLLHFDFFQHDVGYHSAMEARTASGTFGSGRLAAWMRQRVPLVDDEPPSGAQRVLVAADAGSGVSAGLDFARYTFLNADLSVHLARAPRTEWVMLDAMTSSAGNGSALASTRLRDEDGTIGHGLQTLFVDALAVAAR